MDKPNNNKIEELKWIDDGPFAQPPVFEGSGQPVRTVSSILIAKTQENFLVPLGLIATSACLGLGLLNMRRGNSDKQQLFMRGRVIFQGFTLAAMVMGVYIAQRKARRDKFKDED